MTPPAGAPSTRLLREALEVARGVIADETAALAELSRSLGDEFERALTTILNDTDHIIVSGLGKSGIIAQKIAASLTSTGTPASFMHPVEALHGDLGVVTPRHCLMALSRSGNTEEMVRFVAHFRRLGGPVIAVTQARGCRLSELARHTLTLPDVPEAGPLGLAPTTSCVLQLALGDALAMSLLHARGFRAQDFAQYHPEGTLGRRLLLRAADLMHAGDALPIVPADADFRTLIVEMTRKQLGLALITERDGRLLGTFTDGDLRRVFERVEHPHTLTARLAHERSRRPADAPAVRQSTVAAGALAVECLRIMRSSEITSLVVANDDGRAVGVLRLLDLLNAGLA